MATLREELAALVLELSVDAAKAATDAVCSAYGDATLRLQSILDRHPEPSDAGTEIARLRRALEELAATPIIECLSAETWRMIVTDQTAYIRAVLKGQAAVDALRAKIAAEDEASAGQFVPLFEIEVLP